MTSFLASLMNSRGLARELSKAVIGSAGVWFVGMAVTFLVGVQLARYLGPAGYGVYGTFMAIAAILIVFAQMGLPQLITREVSGKMAKGDFSGTKGALVWFPLGVLAASLVMMLVGFIGFVVWRGGFDAGLTGGFIAALAIVPLFALTNVFASALRGFHRVVRAQLFEVVLRPLLFAVFLLAAFFFAGSMDASRALMLHAAAAAVVLVVCVALLLRVLPRQVQSASPTLYLRDWISSATSMTGTDIVRSIDSQYGVLLLGFLVTVQDVGIFRVAAASAAFIALPGTIIAMVILPYVAKFHAQRQKKMLQKLAAVSALAAFAGTAILIGIFYFFGQALIETIFGHSFVSAWPPLMIISLAFAIQAYFGQTAVILNMSGEEKTLTVAFATALVISVFVAVLLIPYFGVIGLAAAMVVSETIRSLIMWRRATVVVEVDTSVASIFKTY